LFALRIEVPASFSAILIFEISPRYES